MSNPPPPTSSSISTPPHIRALQNRAIRAIHTVCPAHLPHHLTSTNFPNRNLISSSTPTSSPQLTFTTSSRSFPPFLPPPALLPPSPPSPPLDPLTQPPQHPNPPPLRPCPRLPKHLTTTLFSTVKPLSHHPQPPLSHSAKHPSLALQPLHMRNPAPDLHRRLI